MKIIALILLSFNFSAYSKLVPENDLWIGPEQKINNINEREFTEVLDRLQEIYKPIATAKDAIFIIERDWKNGKVNASAHRNGKYWRVYMYGGLARHKAITKDGFALVVCHEIGHHFGGLPRIGNFYEAYGMEQKIIVYCSSRECKDSHTFADKLSEMGYKSVKVFSGGFSEWEQGDCLVEKN